MSKLTEAVAAIVVVSLMLLVFNSVWNFVKQSELQSCVNLVASDIAEHSKIAPKLTRNDKEWYVLTVDEAKAVLSDGVKDDCRTFGSQPLDISNNDYQIVLRKTGEHSFEVAVRSNGFDNISGTEDDIITPNGEKIPD